MEKTKKESLTFKNKDISLDYIVNPNENVSLFLGEFGKNNAINFVVSENAVLKVAIISDIDLNSTKITANLQKNAQIEIYFADFSFNGITLDVVINLHENGASAVWHLASLADKKDKKNISVSIMHNAPETYGKVDNYGVCKNDAKLLFAGTSHIVNGSIKSKTQQNAKIMVFDEHSDAIAKPILKIDENDIEANHAAAVGKISDEHLFYLTSRGISMEEARTLITLGYLKPIFKGFDDDKVEYLNKLIGGRL